MGVAVESLESFSQVNEVWTVTLVPDLLFLISFALVPDSDFGIIVLTSLIIQRG